MDDVDETVRALVAQGLEVAPIDPDLAEPQRDRTAPGWFKVAYVRDPDGNWMELYQHAEAAASYNPDGY